MKRLRVSLAMLFASCGVQAQQEARILDLDHYSSVFNEKRNFRVFLPPGYEASAPERYPVIYFFHGWSERYNKPPRGRGGYDSGGDYDGDNISRFVGSNKVIVVKWDGYNPRSPGEDYPRPYNISPVETYRQFPLYFPELVSYIDANFRTIADREHRATAGLSMGGFMSYWVAGKYPHLVGSASNFMGSSEFYVGPKQSPTEYRHDEMYRNYEGLRTRHVTGSRDFIRWYHRRMNAIWDVTRPNHEYEDFEYDHGTPGMAKTLAFHMNAFRDPLRRPGLWHHADVYPAFDVWGYSVETDRQTPGFTVLENVTSKGLRVSAQEWLPDGRLLPEVSVRVLTDSLYEPNKPYRVTDVNLSTREVKQIVFTSDAQGKLRLQFDGSLHEIGISPSPQPILTVTAWSLKDALWATSGSLAQLKLTLLNKGSAKSRRVQGKLVSQTTGVRIVDGAFTIPILDAGKHFETSGIALEIDKTAQELVQLAVEINGVSYPFEIPVFRKLDSMPPPVIVDGSKVTLWQRAIHKAEIPLGSGNADGKAQPGEKVVLAVHDGDALRAVEVLTQHPCAGISERVSDPWGAYDNVGATAKYTVVNISSTCKEASIPLVVQYQLPSKPEHVLKQAVFLVPITSPGT